jgi:exopolyphosphatase/guanosine-5'-triphosphate,3'-diphosphate pyrophosphatase
MDEAGVASFLATATSAVRDASNPDDFLNPASDVLGGPVAVLEAIREGELSYRGATSELDAEAGPFLVVDVGGGSTELVTAPSEHAGGVDVDVVSLDIGCVRVTERWLHSDPPTSAEMETATAHIASLLDDHRVAARFRQAETMVGLAGTVSALTMLSLQLPAYDRDAVHHAVLRLEVVQGLLEDMASMPLALRRQMIGMERARADVLIGGALVLITVMSRMGHLELIVSEADILDGAVAELLGC